VFHSSPSKLFPLITLPLMLISLASGLDARAPRSVDALQELVNRLSAELGLQASITAVIVPANPLLVSVQPVEGSREAFRMAFEEHFLTGLDEEEVTAIVAHELGHVWIFTHHPYLQTERLANKVAMRVVPRANLERVYSKVWAREGVKGDMLRFLGPR
jgi:hypothetical protein